MMWRPGPDGRFNRARWPETGRKRQAPFLPASAAPLIFSAVVLLVLIVTARMH